MPTWPSATSAVRRAKPANARESGARHTQVFVDDGTCSLANQTDEALNDQGILARLDSRLDSTCAGLDWANVDERRPLDMTGVYFARIIHDSFLSPRCLERPDDEPRQNLDGEVLCSWWMGFPGIAFVEEKIRIGFGVFLAKALSLVVAEFPSSPVMERGGQEEHRRQLVRGASVRESRVLSRLAHRRMVRARPGRSIGRNQ